jgi:hypothetical protein
VYTVDPIILHHKRRKSKFVGIMHVYYSCNWMRSDPNTNSLTAYVRVWVISFERTWWWWVLVTGEVPEAGDLGTWYSAAAAEGAQSSPVATRDRERAGEGLGSWESRGWWAAGPDGTGLGCQARRDIFSSKANTRSPLAARGASWSFSSGLRSCGLPRRHDSRRWGFPDATADG